ncbi:hypothetical protein B0H11DRAFT_2252019 [Mycena galericulata]|nr:hypothetical protein B0H11DRAFT_2252019 [Mycena galericulata]
MPRQGPERAQPVQHQPYSRIPRRLPLHCIRQLFGSTDELDAMHVEQLFDINANRHYPGEAPAPILLSCQQLEVVKSYQVLDAACLECELPVAILGYAEYVFADDRKDELHPRFSICKACFVYSLCNPGGNWADEKPPCTCAPGTIACEDVNTQCELHVVPAVETLPLGITRVTRKLDRFAASRVLEKTLEDACDYWGALPDDHPAQEAAKEKFVDALKVLKKFVETPYHLFDMPLPPAPAVPLLPAHMRELGGPNSAQWEVPRPDTIGELPDLRREAPMMKIWELPGTPELPAELHGRLPGGVPEQGDRFVWYPQFSLGFMRSSLDSATREQKQPQRRGDYFTSGSRQASTGSPRPSLNASPEWELPDPGGSSLEPPSRFHSSTRYHLGASRFAQEAPMAEIWELPGISRELPVELHGAYILPGCVVEGPNCRYGSLLGEDILPGASNSAWCSPRREAQSPHHPAGALHPKTPSMSESFALGAEAFAWDRTRGSDFRCLGQTIHTDCPRPILLLPRAPSPRPARRPARLLHNAPPDRHAAPHLFATTHPRPARRTALFSATRPRTARRPRPVSPQPASPPPNPHAASPVFSTTLPRPTSPQPACLLPNSHAAPHLFSTTHPRPRRPPGPLVTRPRTPPPPRFSATRVHSPRSARPPSPPPPRPDRRASPPHFSAPRVVDVVLERRRHRAHRRRGFPATDAHPAPFSAPRASGAPPHRSWRVVDVVPERRRHPARGRRRPERGIKGGRRAPNDFSLFNCNHHHQMATPNHPQIALVLNSPPSPSDAPGCLYAFRVFRNQPRRRFGRAPRFPRAKIKIGRAKNPQRRRREWTRQCRGQRVKWWYWWYVPFAKKFERLIHTHFRVHGAWLEPSACGFCLVRHQELFDYGRCGGKRGVALVVEGYLGILGWPSVKTTVRHSGDFARGDVVQHLKVLEEGGRLEWWVF